MSVRTQIDRLTRLQRIGERAQRNPLEKHHSLAHLLNEEAMKEAFARIKAKAAVGVDGVTKDQYGHELDKNVHDLVERLKANHYRHQAIRRVHIPKDNGKTRPIGISTIEDKLVQSSIAQVLGAIYEPTFYEGSFGFRPERSAHDAIRAINAWLKSGQTWWVLEADIESFFDSISRAKLMEMLRQRIADERFMRLIGKCLHVGVLDGEQYEEPELGTAQGSILSPLLGNVYLDVVLDQWFVSQILPELQGRARLIRYADDCAPRRRGQEPERAA